MIVSFKKQFIFVAIPKTATHSFREALRPYLGSNDWEQCVLFEKKFFPLEPIAEIGHGHISGLDIQPYLLPGMWESFFSFCTVRNPYERFASYCRFVNRTNHKMRNDPLETMKRIVSEKESRKGILFRPQHEFVTDSDGELLVDFVCRFDSLQKDFDYICDKLHVPKSELQHVNTSGSDAPLAFFDWELKEMVLSFYKRDFDLFNFSTELRGSVECQ